MPRTAKQRKESVRADSTDEKPKKGLRVVMVPVTSLIAKAADNPRFSAYSDPESAARKFLASDDFDALSRSFEKLGIQEPLLVEEMPDGRMRVLDGWIRTQYGIKKDHARPGVKLPCVVKTPKDDKDRLSVQIAMNTARTSFDPIAKAHAYERMVEAWGTELSAAKHCGVSVTAFRETLALLKLPKQVQRSLSEQQITVQTAEHAMRMPGFKEWVKADEAASSKGEDVDDATLEAASEYEDRLNFVLGKARSGKRMGQADFSQVWNDYRRLGEAMDAAKGKKGKSAKGKKPKAKADDRHNTDAIVTVTPTEGSIKDAIEFYGRCVAEEIVKEKVPDDGVIENLTTRIEHLAAVMGWCVPEALQNVLTDRKRRPLYDPKIAARLCRETVAEAALLGLLALRAEQDRALAEDDDLNGDAEWMAFYKRDLPLRQMVKELDERLVKSSKQAAA